KKIDIKIKLANIIRLAQRAGIRDINTAVFNNIIDILKSYLIHLINMIAIFMKQKKRGNIVFKEDICEVLESFGRPICELQMKCNYNGIQTCYSNTDNYQSNNQIMNSVSDLNREDQMYVESDPTQIDIAYDLYKRLGFDPYNERDDPYNENLDTNDAFTQINA